MEKIVTLKKLTILRHQRLKNKTVVLVTGVFDILHLEHVRFLQNAKKEGDILLVGIEADDRVRQLKGKGRPINREANRAEVIAALEHVDWVFVLPQNLSTTKGREQLIKATKPDVYAISENTPFQEEKKRIIKLVGGQLKIVRKFNPSISSTRLINAKRIKNR